MRKEMTAFVPAEAADSLRGDVISSKILHGIKVTPKRNQTDANFKSNLNGPVRFHDAE